MNDNEIGSIIVDCAVHLHQALGPGLLESVYEVIFCNVFSVSLWLCEENWIDKRYYCTSRSAPPVTLDVRKKQTIKPFTELTCSFHHFPSKVDTFILRYDRHGLERLLYFS